MLHNEIRFVCNYIGVLIKVNQGFLTKFKDNNMHIVLLGDSIFDNIYYITEEEKSVIDQLGSKLPTYVKLHYWTYVKFARSLMTTMKYHR